MLEFLLERTNLLLQLINSVILRLLYLLDDSLLHLFNLLDDLVLSISHV